MELKVKIIAEALMRAVAAAGIRPEEAEIATRIMREELRAFLFEPRYAAEREVALRGEHRLAMGGLAAECVARIVAARKPVAAAV